MAALKRKADHGATPSKKGKTTSSDPSVKRRKSQSATEPLPTRAKPEKPVTKSIFHDEEKSFPRGGASVLTPLEHKQIHIKANQDVLFEQAGIKRTGDDGLSDMGSDDGVPTTTKPPKKRHSKKNKTLNQDGEKEEVIRTDGLSYKVGSGLGCSPQDTYVYRKYYLAPLFSAKSLQLPNKTSSLPSRTISSDTRPLRLCQNSSILDWRNS